MSEEAERALRALMDATTLPASAADDPLPLAGTALLLAEGERGPRVLMMRRPDRGSFPGAWVFPGGRVEPGDEIGRAGEQEVARAAAARETNEEVGLAVDETALVPFSRWTPPRGIPKRIRTWFFLARAADDPLTLSADEVAEAAWVHPADVLDQHAQGSSTLYPPTWVSLYELARAASVDDALARARERAPSLFATVIRHRADGAVFVWDPDVAWDDKGDLDAPGRRHRLETGTLPWRYRR